MRHNGIRSATFISLIAVSALVGLAGRPVTAQSVATTTAVPINGRIAFESSRPPAPIPLRMIWSVAADGSDLQGPLTATDVQVPDLDSGEAAFSPDGTKIAYYTKNFAGGGGDLPCCAEIAVMNADGTNRQLLINGHGTTFCGFNDQPAWSPDGREIVFVTCDPSGHAALGVVNADGTGFHFLLTTDSFDAIYHPSWSPGGSTIAFTQIGAGEVPHIVTISSDGTGGEVDLGTIGYDPAYSPDGTKIAYYEPGGENDTGIWVMNADGSGAVRLTTTEDAQPAWSPDGTKFVFTSRRDGLSWQIYTMNADGSNQRLISTAHGETEVSPSWGRALSNDLVVTDCSDPSLSQVTSVSGDLVANDVPGCTTINLGNLTTVAGGVIVTGEPALTTVNLGSLTSVASDVTVTGTGLTNLDLGSLTTVAGNITVTGDTSLTTVNLGANTTGGNLAVAGSVTVSTAGKAIDLSHVSTNGDLTLTGSGSDTVSAQTATGTTTVTLLGGSASMRVIIPQGAFDQSVPFTITALPAAAPVAGTDSAGAPAQISTIAAYQFSFAVPTLNQDAQLAFTIDLSTVDAATRTALLDGVQTDATTIAVTGDAAGSTPQALPRCVAGATPQADDCVAVSLADVNGQQVEDPSAAAFVLLSGVAGHFSTYAVALVAPRDTEAPAVTIALTSPNGGVPNGQSGWFVGAPVVGIVSADDRATGDSAIATIACGSVSLSTSGLGTSTAAATFAIATDGMTSIACTATDAAGNTSAPVSATVHLDAHGPVLAPSVTPNPVVLHAAASAIPNASDSTSGIATQSCGAPETSTVGSHSVNCSATDVAGNVGTASAPYTVMYSTGACLGAPGHQVLDPIAADGSSVFKSGRTVPVKVRVCDASGVSIGAPGVIADFRLIGLVNGTSLATVSDLPESTTPDAAFRWDAAAQQWVFNLSTKGLLVGVTYVYDITLNDGSHLGFRFGVR